MCVCEGREKSYSHAIIRIPFFIGKWRVQQGINHGRVEGCCPNKNIKTGSCSLQGFAAGVSSGVTLVWRSIKIFVVDLSAFISLFVPRAVFAFSVRCRVP